MFLIYEEHIYLFWPYILVLYFVPIRKLNKYDYGKL